MTDLLNTTCSIAQRATLRLFSDWSVHGEENVPPMGPLIVVANHVSNFDPPLVSASFPRRIWFLAKKELFKGPGKWFFTAYGAHPVNRSATDPTAYRWALEKLATDQCVMIFPGGHTKSDWRDEEGATGRRAPRHEIPGGYRSRRHNRHRWHEQPVPRLSTVRTPPHQYRTSIHPAGHRRSAERSRPAVDGRHDYGTRRHAPAIRVSRRVWGRR